MRDYAKISPQFWIGKSGKALRGDQEAQIVALYLMTSPHSEMTGVFHCPILYIAHETGLSMEWASKGLASLIEAGFCTFEAANDTVFVHEMAKYQIGEELKPNDNRVIGVQKIYANMPESLIRRGFYEKYRDVFYLKKDTKKASPSEAPSKPRAGTGTGEETNNGRFADFWLAYPNKKNKANAEKAFLKTKADDSLLATMLQAIEVQKGSAAWVKDGGQFIPHAATWLNGKRWEDEDGSGGAKPWEV